MQLESLCFPISHILHVVLSAIPANYSQFILPCLDYKKPNNYKPSLLMAQPCASSVRYSGKQSMSKFQDDRAGKRELGGEQVINELEWPGRYREQENCCAV